MRANIKTVLVILVFGILISSTYQADAENIDPFELNFSSVKYTGIEQGDTFTWKLISGELWSAEGVNTNDNITVESIYPSNFEVLGSETSMNDRFNQTIERTIPLESANNNEEIPDDIISALIYPNYALLDNGTELNMIELFWFHDFNFNLIQKPWLDWSCASSEESSVLNLDCSIENEAGVISKAVVYIHKETGVALHLNTSIYYPAEMDIQNSNYRLDLIETNNILLKPVLIDFSPDPLGKVVESKASLDTKSVGLYIIIISGFGVTGYLGYYLISSKGNSILTNDQTKAILKQMFNGKTPDFIALAGLIYKKDRTYGSGTNIPSEMFDFKFLMHPVRLAIMKLLIENPLMTTTDLRSQLNLSWGEISNHINSLKKYGLIQTENKIIENSVKQVISANLSGIQEFNKLSHMLTDFFNSPNYESYLEEVDKVISDDGESQETDLAS